MSSMSTIEAAYGALNSTDIKSLFVGDDSIKETLNLTRQKYNELKVLAEKGKL